MAYHHLNNNNNSLSKNQCKGTVGRNPLGYNTETELVQSTSNQSISVQTKIDVMQSTCAKCPTANILCKGGQIPSLLDSGYEVML